MRLIGRLRNFVRRYILNRDLEAVEREVLEVLKDGKRREANVFYRAAEAKDDEKARKRAEEAAREALEITAMIEGVTDMYSYGRTNDE